MRSNRASRTKIWLFLELIFLFTLLLLFHKIREWRTLNLQKIETYKYNFFAVGDPSVAKRARPVTAAKLEVDLITRLGAPFSSFNDEEWSDFWELIYGVYPKVEPEKPGLPNKVRQLTPGEIISELQSRYPEPFSRFTKKQWDVFFSVVSSR